MIMLAVIMIIPMFAFAQSITIPCDGPKLTTVGTTTTDTGCNFDRLVDLAVNVMNFLILLSIPVTAIACAWAGGIMVMSGGSESKKEEAKEIFTKVIIGFVFVLSAWLIVKLITSALILDKTSFTDLLQ